MPGLARRNEELSNASSVSAKGFWVKHRHDVSFNQLQKFWSELSPQARHKLLRVDKQNLFEQARKNMYCSRCNGLLLEGFLQIVLYGKSLQHEGGGTHNAEASKHLDNGGVHVIGLCQDEIQDPFVHPWGGLMTTREGSLTLLNCYLYAKSLKTLQNVFDSARARERERELLYPDACGGGGRGWISQGMASYGRGHGTRETCALHTAKLSCDTLVDFWSALGEETRQSLLRMKEEDFIERLMCRFDNKRFCRDCRRNVIREFKELKELKRMRRETRCTNWFCVADTAFQYEVSDDTIQVDWRQSFADTGEIYHHFEWAVGTGEGKSDILEFENVGMNGSVQVNGLDLGGLSACFITLRAWKLDGRCAEISVKAHALKGKECLHCRVVVGDGYVSITRGERIRRFFEHAEEVEEEEDDDSVDKDGNELDDECSRPQKHAKSPELAREFLLDAATVIFKEQVEKAFREGTARQNAHSIFVCLAIKLLEERIHVACKEIITLEKQMKLLEEEEKEKRDEEERKERRRTKEREKKLRRKERLKRKEKDKEKNCTVSDDISALQGDLKNESLPHVNKETSNAISCLDSVNEIGDISLSRPESPSIPDNLFSDGYTSSTMPNGSYESPDGEFTDMRDGTGSFTVEQSKISHQRSKFWKEALPNSSFKWPDRRRFTIISDSGAGVSKSESRRLCDNFGSSSRGINGLHRQSRVNGPKSSDRTFGIKFREKLHCTHNKMNDSYDFHSCRCRQNDECGVKVEPHVSVIGNERENKSAGKSASALDMTKEFYHGNNHKQIDYACEGFGRTKSKCNNMSISSIIDAVPSSNKVSELMESQKRYSGNNLNADVTPRPSFSKTEGVETLSSLFKSSGDTYSSEITATSGGIDHGKKTMKESRNCNMVTDEDCCEDVKDSCYSTVAAYEEVGCCPAKISFPSGTCDHSIDSTSNSDNCSSCLSEGDSNTVSSNHGNMESSSTSDSEDSSQYSEGRETSLGIGNGFANCQEAVLENKLGTNGGESFGSNNSSAHVSDSPRGSSLGNLSTKSAPYHENGIPAVGMSAQHHDIFPPMCSQNMHFSVFQAPTKMDYYQNPVSWSTSPGGGLMTTIPHPDTYLYSGHLGYGSNGNSRMSMQYNAPTHLAAPLFNPGQFPFYHPVAKANGLHSEELIWTRAVQETFAGANAERMAQAKQYLTETPHGYGRKIDIPCKLQTGDTGFSLFHFGGPVALSTGCKPDVVSSKDGIVGDFSSKISVGQAEDNPACNKKETSMEEYNLFAASNGIRFSFF